MKFPDNYICLKRNSFKKDDFELIPIRYEDRELIRQWRNEQIYHLRQHKELSPENQDYYFQNVVQNIFTETHPTQLLFSFFHQGQLVGYGGLVHINWIDRNAEISFIMNTSLEQQHFENYWVNYLSLIEKVGFSELDFHKIYTYAFDLRPKLYIALESAGFQQEAVLKEHCYFDLEFRDVLIHVKFNPIKNLLIREANSSDLMTYFNWANDPDVRQNSIHSNSIQIEEHMSWFDRKLSNPDTIMYLFSINGKAVGNVRLDKTDDYWVISYLVDLDFRGMRLGFYMLKKILEMHPDKHYLALVKEGNVASLKVFQNLGFKIGEDRIIDQQEYKTFYYE